MAFNPTTLTLNELLVRAQRICGGSFDEAMDYLKSLQGVTRTARAAVAVMLQFHDRCPAARRFSVDAMGRLQPLADEPLTSIGKSVEPAWIRRAS